MAIKNCPDSRTVRVDYNVENGGEKGGCVGEDVVGVKLHISFGTDSQGRRAENEISVREINGLTVPHSTTEASSNVRDGIYIRNDIRMGEIVSLEVNVVGDTG